MALFSVSWDLFSDIFFYFTDDDWSYMGQCVTELFLLFFKLLYFVVVSVLILFETSILFIIIIVFLRWKLILFGLEWSQFLLSYFKLRLKSLLIASEFGHIRLQFCHLFWCLILLLFEFLVFGFVFFDNGVLPIALLFVCSQRLHLIIQSF